jgi:hypothetical protein
MDKLKPAVLASRGPIPVYVTKEGDVYECDHVAKKPEKRCERVGNGGVVASEACPKTCGAC